VPDPPHYFFKPQDTVSRAQYDCGFPVNELMPVNSAGAITARDHFVVDFDREALLARIADLASLNSTDNEIRRRYFSGLGSTKYPEGDTRGWKLPEARRAIRADGAWRSRVRRYLYRPFDYRYVYWTPSMVDWPRPELERQLGAPNQLALCITRFNRQQSTGYFFVTRVMADFHCLDTAGDSTSLFPLRLAASEDLGLDDRLRGYNLSHEFGQRLSTAFGAAQAFDGLPDDVDPESVVGFVYAIFHSPGFRSRYAEFLKIDFPRVPIPRSPSLLTDLAFLGQQLIALHLLESPQLDVLVTTYSGPTNPKVGRVAWSEHVVWLDAAATKKGQPATPGSIGFVGVPEPVWSFHVGGYQVCEKWLKDRKGRTLTEDDIAHYQKIIVALTETIRLMKEIDEVIDRHGGWPDAFQTMTAGQSPT
jgi:predicted helicase